MPLEKSVPPPENLPSEKVDIKPNLANKLKALFCGCFKESTNSQSSLEIESVSKLPSPVLTPSLTIDLDAPGLSLSEIQRTDSFNSQKDELVNQPPTDQQLQSEKPSRQHEHDQFKTILETYKLTRKPVGSGTFAVVYKGLGKLDEVTYALKFIDKKVLADLGQTSSLVEREIDVLKRIQHRNVISLHQIFETRDAIVLVTDFAFGGELMSRFYDVPIFTELEAVKLMKQLFEGVAYLHEQGIVHRDIKPENILLKEATERLGDAQVMIADFGLARVLKTTMEPLVTACGTPQYVAPEILTGKGYSTPVDLWSCGVVMYFLLCGYVPYQGNDQQSLLDSIQTAELYFLEEDWCDISTLGRHLIRQLLERDPDKRPTALEALQHPWFSDSSHSVTEEFVDPDHANLHPKLLKNRDTNKMLRNAMARLKAVHQFNSLLVHHFRDNSLVESPTNSDNSKDDEALVL